MPEKPVEEGTGTVYQYGNDTDAPSRTAKRKSARAEEGRVRQLVLDLAAISPARLRRLKLPAELEDGILLCAGIPASKAKVRQVKQLARSLLELDHETIRRTLAAPGALAKPRGNRSAYAAEWLSRLESDPDGSLIQLLQAHPELDRQQLRSWLRTSLKERNADGAPKPAGLKARENLQRKLGELQAPSADLPDDSPDPSEADHDPTEPRA